MPDSLLPPGWGFAPFDERYLDAVLSGKTADVPVALRPVADVLASLRVGPVPAELYGEANAMAEFRALGLGQAGHLAGPAPTRVLEALPAGRRGRHRVRPGRRSARRAILRPAVLACAAAAAVIALAVLITGNITGPFRDIAHMARPSAGSPSAAGSTGRSTAPRVEASSSALYTTTPPSATYSTPPPPTPGEICHAYYAGYIHPGLSAWAAQESLWEQLTKLAHSDSWIQAFRYCAPYVKDLFPAGQNQAPPAPEHPGPGYQNNSGQQNGAAQGSRTGSGSDQGDTQGSSPTPAP